MAVQTRAEKRVLGRLVTVGVIQYAPSPERERNLKRAAELIREACARGAGVILLPELFEHPYFPRQEKEQFFEWALPMKGHPTIATLASLAAELRVVLPVSFFERSSQAYYNSVAMVDADGSVLGVYRKSHIPDGPGYEEKYYFRPGDTGFRVWETKYGPIGVGICWDQWFPECARSMACQGAELLLYPTTIGSEPETPDLDTRDPWQRVMTGHAVANWIPIAAANRVGLEGDMRFYGSSFIVNPRGDIVGALDRDEEGIALATFDLDVIRLERAAFGFFRDRRPELY